MEACKRTTAFLTDMAELICEGGTSSMVLLSWACARDSAAIIAGRSMLLQLEHGKRTLNKRRCVFHLPVIQRIVEKLLHRVQLFVDLRTVTRY